MNKKTTLNWVKFTLLFLISTFLQQGISQPSYIYRYKEAIFDNISVHRNILYTAFQIPVLGNENTLKLDFYEPAGDSTDFRPMVIFAHGGAFIKGDREDESITMLAKELAKRGYATASIDYRIAQSASLLKCGYQALQDAKASVRYFKANAAEYRIDTSLIFFGGISAGGVMALHLAFLDGDEAVPGSEYYHRLRLSEEKSTDAQYSADVKGIINICGGIIDTSIIETRNRVASIHFHGTHDRIIDFHYGLPFGLISPFFNSLLYEIEQSEHELIQSLKSFWTALSGDDFSSGIRQVLIEPLYGSYPISKRLESLAMNHTFVPFERAGHYLLVSEQGNIQPTYSLILDETVRFLHHQIMPTLTAHVSGETETYQGAIKAYNISGNYAHIYCKVEGGEIVKEESDKVMIDWSQQGTGSIYFYIGDEKGYFTEVQKEVEVSQPTLSQKMLSFWNHHYFKIILAIVGLFVLGFIGRKLFSLIIE